jgi:predicted Zn-dependent protease
MHNVQWLIKSAPDNWAIWAYAGELFKHYGMMDDARAHFNKSLELAPNKWADENTPPSPHLHYSDLVKHKCSC